MQRPKPIRTSISAWPAEKHERSRVEHERYDYQKGYVSSQKTKSEGGFVKTKSKALKIYSDLKKVKQPISPGRRLASFLNSLFTAGNAKKAKISSMYEERKMKTEPESTCSSASSFSRSCLSKTPSSRGKLSNNGMKRSVRFYPVSVIVDEDCRPCGHKNLYEKEELKYHVMSESKRVEEAARELLKNYQKKKKEEEFDHNEEFDEEEEEDGDAASYASSDLFELDNLSAIGIERYREELPVYETTHLDTNRAIASGLIL
ncbi:Protein BIG GRAIN 1-like [Melia azedarach]|uniref:Protein BIG GRAIN 1-like n=1 Tax=Melia azedarach TaxID=155640 RepID=A0ACC1Y2B8_MELAZ|nr:Protein BIG GRAIN 1-like [Melia azedarach]